MPLCKQFTNFRSNNERNIHTFVINLKQLVATSKYADAFSIISEQLTDSLEFYLKHQCRVGWDWTLFHVSITGKNKQKQFKISIITEVDVRFIVENKVSSDNHIY